MLIANLPYSVAAAVMANLITGPIVCDSMYVTVQKEVAERMVATAGGKDYGVLSIFTAATGQAKILRKLKPSVFWPQPQVESAMLTFRRQPKKAEQIHNMDFFKEIVNLFMGHRRKMLKACVKFSEGRLEKIHNWNDIFNRAVIDPQLRPEELSAENYIAIANLCYRQIH
jgi:16S rRNA (adenine1518-N6/adenine1519-N6)-dimethyltransferase